MRIALFDTHSFEEGPFTAANEKHGHELTFLQTRLDERTAVLAKGFACVCPFVNDRVDRAVLTALQAGGTSLVALRSAGFNHVDLVAAEELGLVVARVPAYSPYAVAEHAVALLLALNRKIQGPTPGCGSSTSRSTGWSASTCTEKRRESWVAAESAASWPGFSPGSGVGCFCAT